jgi:hypothetical protein
MGHTLLDLLQNLAYFIDNVYLNTPRLIIGARASLVLRYSRRHRFVKRLSYTL